MQHSISADPLDSPPTARTSVLTVDDIRRCFPALQRRHRDEHVAYFDGPGGTQVPREVVETMADYLYHHNANTHWSYPTSAETDAALDAARHALADFLGATSDEIAFGNNMTTITFHLARALGRRWGPGDEVVVTELDHHANVAPWMALAHERGVTVRLARMIPDSGQLDWDDLERSITSRTRLVAIGAASNALGTISDVRQAADLAQARGALTFVDAVHFAPHELVDVGALRCDLLACSAYKFYGPHVGVLFCRRDLIGEVDVPKLSPAPDVGPERFETGTQNHEGIIGAAAAVDFLAAIGFGHPRRARLSSAFAALHERGQALVTRLWDGLAAIEGVRLFGPPPSARRTPTVAFTVAGRTTDSVARALADRGVWVSHGDFYATTVIERCGQAADGVVRAGCACYTTAEEVDRLIDGVRKLGR
jgi:cysteine desulfurase family protein (TIGR01976 family)